MKIKIFILVSCAVLSVGSGMILQAMQKSSETLSPILKMTTEVMASPTARNKFFYKLILERVQDGNVEGALDVLKQGIRQGFDVNYQDDTGKTLLNSVVASNNIDLVRSLLAAGANPNVKLPNGQVPLHVAMTSEIAPLIIKELVKAGADVNAKDNRGYTPLMKAVAEGNIPAVATLRTIAGIDIMAKSAGGRTALDMAKSSPTMAHFLRPSYITLKGLSLDYIKKYRDKFTQEQIKQLPLELQEELKKAS